MTFLIDYTTPSEKTMAGTFLFFLRCVQTQFSIEELYSLVHQVEFQLFESIIQLPCIFLSSNSSVYMTYILIYICVLIFHKFKCYLQVRENSILLNKIFASISSSFLLPNDNHYLSSFKTPEIKDDLFI